MLTEIVKVAPTDVPTLKKGSSIRPASGQPVINVYNSTDSSVIVLYTSSPLSVSAPLPCSLTIESDTTEVIDVYKECLDGTGRSKGAGAWVTAVSKTLHIVAGKANFFVPAGEQLKI